MMHLFAALVIASIGAEPRTAYIGVPQKIEQLVLPGSELEVKPIIDRKLPVVLRIVNVDKHGTAHRYDLSYYTLEPGTFDLRDYLQRKDGTPLGELPEMKVESRSALPVGQVVPHDPAPTRPAFTGGYWLAVIVFAGLWFLIFLAILLVGRKKKAGELVVSGGGSTLADRLRPLVERGMAGKLELAERADLERSLLAYWTKKLKLNSLKPAERFAQLRNHDDAGPLLKQLESWLHKPGTHNGVDVSALLRPYQNLPANALETLPEAARP